MGAFGYMLQTFFDFAPAGLQAVKLGSGPCSLPLAGVCSGIVAQTCS